MSSTHVHKVFGVLLGFTALISFLFYLVSTIVPAGKDLTVPPLLFTTNHLSFSERIHFLSLNFSAAGRPSTPGIPCRSLYNHPEAGRSPSAEISCHSDLSDRSSPRGPAPVIKRPRDPVRPNGWATFMGGSQECPGPVPEPPPPPKTSTLQREKKVTIIEEEVHRL